MEAINGYPCVYAASYTANMTIYIAHIVLWMVFWWPI